MPAQPDVIRPPGPVAPWKLRAWELIVPRLPQRAIRFVARLIQRLPLRSRTRRWWVEGLCQIAWEMTARDRYDLLLPIWDPDCEWTWDPQFAGIGFEDVYRGHDGMVRSLGHWNDGWDDIGFTVHEILDGGDTFVMRMTASGRGVESGAPVQVDVNTVAHLDPLIVRFRSIVDDDEAVREAGFA